MELTTIAKPYAKAINEIATANGNYDNWKTTLDSLAMISKDSLSVDFINSPSFSNADKVSFLTKSLTSIIGRDTSKEENNFMTLLVDNNRVNVSSGIAELFSNFATNNNKHISVISAYDLEESEKSQLVDTLKKKYNCEIILDVSVNKELVGGIVIKDGDKVIDLSITASAEKLAACLAKN